MSDLVSLAAAFRDRLLNRIEAEATTPDPAAIVDQTMKALAITDAAMRRGVLAGHIEFSMSEDDPLATMFATAFAMGEGAALRRAKTALSDPRAKGRELDVLDRLIAGDEIEAAVRPASRPAQPARDKAGAKVIPFKIDPR